MLAYYSEVCILGEKAFVGPITRKRQGQWGRGAAAWGRGVAARGCRRPRCGKMHLAAVFLRGE